MTTQVQICNRALTNYVGKGRINSIDENTPAARQCKINYDDTLQTVLEMHDWLFARSRPALALLANDRPDEWCYRYKKPNAALAIRWVNDPLVAHEAIQRNDDPQAPVQIEGDSIYSDVPDAYASITVLIEDTSKFPMYFANCFSAMLASNIAFILTEDMKRVRGAMDQFTMLLDLGAALDENMEPAQTIFNAPDWLTDRGIS